MAIFVVFRVGEPGKVGAAIHRLFPDNHYELQDDEWLIAASGTARELSDTLGITKGENGNGIIFAMANYYGRATSEIWDWIKAKAEETSG